DCQPGQLLGRELKLAPTAACSAWVESIAVGALVPRATGAAGRPGEGRRRAVIASLGNSSVAS
ncbi:hypothetical protein, partial [Billgrantia endophytica]|uniref:hypothetical protein n=1 Tax=Billgrantia endophytica TaxID=2033802 RepID=UPI00197AFA75